MWCDNGCDDTAGKVVMENEGKKKFCEEYNEILLED